MNTEPRQNPLVSAPLGRSLARLAAPGVLGVLIQSFISVAEAWYLGAVGKTALAGVALIFPLYMLNTMLSAGAVGGAVSGAVARAQGKQDHALTEVIVRWSVIIAICGGLILSLLYQLGGEWFLQILGGRGDVLVAASSYGAVLLPCCVVIWLYNMSAAIFRGSGDMIRPALGIALVSVTHFILAWVFIRGAGPIPAMGMSGAALAIVVAYFIGWIFLACLLRQRTRTFRLRTGALTQDAVIPILKNGLLAANQSVLTVSLALVTTALIARLGDTWLAGYGIGVRLELLMVPLIFGFGSALIAITGANVGAGLRARALRIAWIGAGINALMVGAIGIVLALFPELWTSVTTDSPQIANACATYLRMVGPFYVFFGLGLCLYFASQGFGTLLIPVLGTLLRFLIVAVVGGWLVSSGNATPENIFMVVGGALVAYGLFIALGLRFGPWRR